MSIQNTKFVKNIQNNIHNNKKIKSWLLKYNDLNNTNEFLFEEAEKLLNDLLLIDINFKNLIEFEIIDNIIQIKTIDTCDEIMLEALNIYKKEKNCLNNELSNIVNYIFIYFRHYSNITSKQDTDLIDMILSNYMISSICS